MVTPEVRAFILQCTQDDEETIIELIRMRRTRRNQIMKHELSVGAPVSWDGGHGRTLGTVIRINKTRAVCKMQQGILVNVPFSMLKVEAA